MNSVVLPPREWGKVQQAPRRVLLLDYDGTLSPFRIVREEAWPHPEVVPLLKEIAGAGEAAVLSGRPVRDLARFLEGIPLRLVGEHGWEEKAPDGPVIRHPLPEAQAELLDSLAESAEHDGLGPFLERKRTALVLHTRGVPRPQAAELERAARLRWGSPQAGRWFRLDPIHGGLELRAGGRDKGTAVHELLDRAGAGAAAVYVGDDATDEDAFLAVRRWGFGIRVGPPDPATRALGRIDSCESVAEFLRLWKTMLEGTPAGR